MPSSLDIGPTYSLRVTALDPTTGNVVSGVTVTTMVITADYVNADAPTDGGVIYGDWFLVPGPSA